MPLHQYANYPWLYCTNPDAGNHSNGKLHIALPIECFDEYHQTVYNILKKAVEDGVIPGFKMLNKGDGATLKKAQGAALTIAENPDVRLYNNPFTIYLFEDNNLKNINDLCKQVETILSGLPSADSQHLSIADLPVTTHLTYRQEQIDKQYVSIATATSEELLVLKHLAESATEYQQLIALVKTVHIPLAPKSSEAELIRRENALLRYYNLNYKRLFNQLRTKDAHKQYLAACELLCIDSAELNKQTTRAGWEKMIQQKFRLTSLQYHPDKFPVHLVSKVTKNHAEEMTLLLVEARDLLNEIAKDPSVIDKKKILEQAPSHPEYQFELREGFTSNSYFYVGLARDSNYVFLYQNWELSENPVALTANTASENAIVLYKPQLQLHRKELQMQGWKAFYHLFLANALPRAFGRGNIPLIFDKDDESWTPAQQQLLEKVLTTPEFIGFMHSEDLISLAIKATNEKIIHIGENKTEVFLYYYLNFPETLYHGRIKKFLKDEKEQPGVNLDQITQFILDKPDILAKLQFDGLDALMQLPGINAFVLANKNLAKKLSDYYINHTIFKNENASLNETDEFERIILRELYSGNASFIPLLSNNTINNLRLLIQSNSNQLPAWLEDEIDAALDPLLNQQIISGDDKYPLIAKDFIKKRFLTKNSIVFSLNKETLLELASVPGMDWYDYLPFCEAFLKLGEKHQAKIFLDEIVSNLDLHTETKNLSQAQVLSYLNENHTEILKSSKKQIMEEKIRPILEDYKKALNNGTKQDVELLCTQLKAIDALESTQPIQKKYLKALKTQWFKLVKSLQAGGEVSPEIIDEVNNIKSCLLKIDENWVGFSEWDEDERRIPTQIYYLMQYVLGQKDNWREGLPGYGVSFQEDPLTTFKRLFDLCKLLREGGEFYKMLCMGTNVTITTSKFSSIDTNEFHPDFIKHHILEYLDKELGVYCDGVRKSEGYKAQGNIWHFGIPIETMDELYKLYCSFGGIQHFEDLVSSAHAKLYELHLQNKNFAIEKYIEIRKYSSTIHCEFEQIALGYELHRIIADNRGALRDFMNAQASLEQLHAHNVILNIDSNVQKTLNNIVEFLYYYRDTSCYNNLLSDFQNSVIIREYFRLPSQCVSPNQLSHAFILGFQSKESNTLLSLDGLKKNLPIDFEGKMPTTDSSHITEENIVFLKEKLASALSGFDGLLLELRSTTTDELESKADPENVKTYNKKYIEVGEAARRLHNDLERAKLLLSSTPLTQESCTAFREACRNAIENVEEKFKIYQNASHPLRPIIMGFLGVIVGIIGAALALALLPITITVAVCFKPPVLTKYKSIFFTPPMKPLKKLHQFRDSLLNKDGLLDNLENALGPK